MVERFVRIEEVVVSITISSTKTLRIPPRRVFFFRIYYSVCCLSQPVPGL